MKNEKQPFFTSIFHLMQYLESGGMVKLDKLVYFMENGFIKWFNPKYDSPNDANKSQGINLNAFSNMIPYCHPKWYYDIPKDGILCMCTGDIIRLVVSYRDGTFTTKEGYEYKEVTPLSLMEIEKYVLSK